MTAPTYRPFGTFRFILALLVVVSHTWELTFQDRNFLSQIGIGNVAVMGFFILSGFIITEALATFYRGRFAAFLGNRLARIVPPYWAALLASIVIHAILARHYPVMTSATELLPAGAFDTANLLENVFAIFPRPNRLTFDLTQPFYGFVRFYWAIYVELVFYVVAFLVAAVAALPLVRRARSARLVVIMGSVVAIAIHIGEQYGSLSAWGIYFPGDWSFAFAPYFLIGVCLYFWRVRKDRAALVGLIVSYGLVFIHFSRYTQAKIPLSAEWAAGLLVPHHTVPILLMLAIPPAVMWLSNWRISPAARARDWRLGNLSYPIYLNHWVVIVAFHTLTTGYAFTLQLGAIAASVALSWLLMHAVERPMAPLRDYLRGQPLRT